MCIVLILAREAHPGVNLAYLNQVGKFVLRAEDLRGALQNFGAQT